MHVYSRLVQKHVDQTSGGFHGENSIWNLLGRPQRTILYVLVWIVAELNAGSHLSTVSEDMQAQWFAVEHELGELMSGGLVPGYNIDSAGRWSQSLAAVLLR